VYKILSKLVNECWRYSKPKQCHFWAWLKRAIFGVLGSQGSAETLLRRGGITKLPFNSIFSQQYLCQKLSKSVDVHWSYSIERHCRFLRHSVYTVPENCLPFYFFNKYVKNQPILFVLTLLNREKMTSKAYKFYHLTRRLQPLYLEKSKNMPYSTIQLRNTYFWLFSLS